jgi:hypothetical protein
MAAALAEPLNGTTTTHNNNGTNSSKPSAARAEASRANGRRSHGPTSPEGKARSRRNGCKDGLTGAGIVLPPEAEKEVARREAEFAHDLRPRNAVELELVRQMALGAWRSQELQIRIVRHDAQVNAARFANWEQDERLAAVELGRRLSDDPEGILAQLQRTSAGCDLLIGRWSLLGNTLSTAEESGPGCAWTDADLALALNLLGRPVELRHLDEWASRLESLRNEARSGSNAAARELSEIVEKQIAELQERSDEVWKEVEEPRLRACRSGVELDLGPEGTRLRRYATSAEGLFRSAWTKLERLRKERGEPLMPRLERMPAPGQVARRDPPSAPTPAAAAPATGPVRVESVVRDSMLLSEPTTPVLDFWVAGPPRPRIRSGNSSGNKTNPAPRRLEKGGRAGVLGDLT